MAASSWHVCYHHDYISMGHVFPKFEHVCACGKLQSHAMNTNSQETVITDVIPPPEMLSLATA